MTCKVIPALALMAFLFCFTGEPHLELTALRVPVPQSGNVNKIQLFFSEPIDSLDINVSTFSLSSSAEDSLQISRVNFFSGRGQRIVELECTLPLQRGQTHLLNWKLKALIGNPPGIQPQSTSSKSAWVSIEGYEEFITP